jgi:ABC-2 type transport system permease protein
MGAAPRKQHERKEFTVKSNTLALPARVKPQARPTLYWTLADMFVLAKRQLVRMQRSPVDLVIWTLQPVLILVLIRCIFGGAIAVAGTSYVNYLVTGFLVIAVLLGSGPTGIGMATDLKRGLVDRFRSLPMARSAVLTGRTLSDLLRSILIALVTLAVGLLLGFRPAGTVLEWVAALGLLSLGSLLFIWLSALLGLVLKSAEAVVGAVVIYSYLLMFTSNAMAPTSAMPTWARAFAEHQPVTLIISAVRGLLLNQPDAQVAWQAIAWCVGLLVILIPLTIWAYGHRTVRST